MNKRIFFPINLVEFTGLNVFNLIPNTKSSLAVLKMKNHFHVVKKEFPQQLNHTGDSGTTFYKIRTQIPTNLQDYTFLLLLFFLLLDRF